MKTRMFAVLTLVLGLAFVLAWAVTTQGAQAISTGASNSPTTGFTGAPQDLKRLGTTLTFTPVATAYVPLAVRNYVPPLYFDDFDDPQSGWSTGDDEGRRWGYLNGEYQIYLKNTESAWLVTPDLVLPSDYHIEVDARQASSNASSYGLTFGIGLSADTYEGYQFLVYPNTQQFLMEQRKMDGSWTTLIDWTYSSAIRGGTGTNHLRVDRMGADIYLFINDTLVATFTDSSFTGAGRDAGVRAYSGDRAPVDVRFDNFYVSRTFIVDPLYTDDFSDPGSGWYSGDDGNIRWSYQSGEYEMLLRNTDWWAGVTSPLGGGLAGCSIEADMRRPSGHTSAYGLLFGHVDWDRFYAFVVNPDSQEYGIWKNTSSGWETVVGWTSSGHINPSSATNRLRVDRNGSQIAVYVNGHLLTTASDSTYLGNLAVGLYAESWGHANDVVRFDNFQFDRLGGTATKLDLSMLRETESSVSGGPAPLWED